MNSSSSAEQVPAKVSLATRVRNAWHRFRHNRELPPSIRIARARFQIWRYDWLLSWEKKIKQPLPQNGPRKIHFFYSACESHFGYMILSLRTLLQLNSPHIGKIYVYQDAYTPLTPEQVEQLRALVGERLVLRHFNYQFRTLCALWCCLDAWREIAGEIGSEDLLAKSDSDILWARPTAIDHVLQLDHDLIAHTCDSYKYLTGFEFCQGGIFFLRASLLPKICSLPVSKILLEQYPSLVPHTMLYDTYDDGTTHLLAEAAHAKILLTYFYLPSIEAVKEATGAESVLHYEGRAAKTQMMIDAERLLSGR